MWPVLISRGRTIIADGFQMHTAAVQGCTRSSVRNS
jgi:hypothetical protein